jgi:hypothetical protein
MHALFCTLDVSAELVRRRHWRRAKERGQTGKQNRRSRCHNRGTLRPSCQNAFYTSRTCSQTRCRWSSRLTRHCRSRRTLPGRGGESTRCDAICPLLGHSSVRLSNHGRAYARKRDHDIQARSLSRGWRQRENLSQNWSETPK